MSADAPKDLRSDLAVHGSRGACPCFPACISKAPGWRGEHDHAKYDRKTDKWERWGCGPDLYYCGAPDCAGAWTEHALVELSADNGGRL